MMTPRPWAMAAAAAGFVGGLAVGRAMWHGSLDVDVPTEFMYVPQPPPAPLRVVGGIDPAAVDRFSADLADAIRRHPSGKRRAR